MSKTETMPPDEWDALREWASRHPNRPQPELCTPYRAGIRKVEVDETVLRDFRILARLPRD